ncbi:MAG: acetyl-CoA hydrolase/transferase family protein [Myxococcota bacterium]
MRSTPKRISPAEAAALVKSGDWIDYGAGAVQPSAFDRALAARAPELRGVKIRANFTGAARAVLEADPTGEHFTWLSWHMSAYDRAYADRGLAHYIPMNFGEAPDYYRRFLPPVDLICIQAAPMGGGWFNFGVAATYVRAITERARCVVIEENPALPAMLGSENAIHASDVSYVIPGDGAPPPELPNPPASDVDRAVAKRIAEHIEHGACLQIGVGGMPNAVCSLLRETGVRDLGIHTELLTESMLELYEAGVITGARKQLNRGQMVCTFAGGSRALYAFAHRNPAAQSFAVDYTNAPDVIARNDGVIAINSTTQLDLQGQAASESDGHRHISGTGGQLQFVRGAYASRGGKAFLCLPSTYEKRGVRKSRIVTTLTPGNIVTTPRTDVMYVVTEHGCVNLKGMSVPERATALTALAHPDFREALAREARELNLIPRRWV